MRITFFLALTAIITALSSCNPVPEKHEENMNIGKALVLELFEEITSADFLADAETENDGETIHITKTVSCGIGELSIIIDHLHAAYTLSGEIEKDGTKITLSELKGPLKQGKILSTPVSGDIAINGEDCLLVTLLPEEDAEFNEENITVIAQTLVRDAFALFPYIPSAAEVVAMENATAELGANKNGWKLVIRAEKDGLIMIEADSESGKSRIVYNEHEFFTPLESLLEKSVIPPYEEDVRETEYIASLLEKARTSNLLFAFRSLVNGSSSRVISLESFDVENGNEAQASLLLSDYSIGDGIRISGQLEITLTGSGYNMDGYIFSSDGILFTDGDNTRAIRLESLSGAFEGDTPPCIVLTEEEDGWDAGFSTTLRPALPETGKAISGEVSIDY